MRVTAAFARSAAGGLVLLLTCWAGAGLAQTQPTETPGTQGVAVQNAVRSLAPEQKLMIYQSVTATHKNNAAPPAFRAAVGAQVPAAVELQPMPNAVATVIPDIKDMKVAMIEKEVVIVDPNSRTVLAVVTEAE